jgi:hypothetical protein
MKASLKKLNLWLLSVSHCAYRAWHFECSEQNDRSNNADIEIEEELASKLFQESLRIYINIRFSLRMHRLH